MLERYLLQFFLLAVFFMLVYAVVETCKNFIIALPDGLGRWCREGFPTEIKRWISFVIAYFLAWMFDFKFAQMVFETVNEGSLPSHTNYFIVSCLLFCGSKWIHEQISTHFAILQGKRKEKKCLT